MSELILIKQKQLKTRSHYELLRVYQYSKLGWEVSSIKNGHKNLVTFDMKLATLVCTCMFGSQEIGSEKIDENHRCKHIQSVREHLRGKEKK